MKTITVALSMLLVFLVSAAFAETAPQAQTSASTQSVTSISDQGGAQRILDPSHLTPYDASSPGKIRAQRMLDQKTAALNGYDPNTGAPMTNPYNSDDALVLLRKRAKATDAYGHRIKTAVDTRMEQQESMVGMTTRLRTIRQQRIMAGMMRRTQRPLWATRASMADKKTTSEDSMPRYTMYKSGHELQSVQKFMMHNVQTR